MGFIYNKDENRLRGFFRIVLQFAAFITLIIYIPPVFSPYIKSDFWYIFADEIFYTGAAVLTVFLAVKLLDKRKISEIGIQFNHGWFRRFLIGFGFGFVIISSIFIVLYLTGIVTINEFFHSKLPESFTLLIIVRFIGYLLVAFNEELVFRGYQLRNIEDSLSGKNSIRRTPEFYALIITSLLFGLVHSLNPDVTIMSLLNLIVIGLLYGYAFLFTKTLAIPVGIHAAWNFTMGNVYGFPVSGFHPYVSIFNVSIAGPEFLSGGKFGPEGGVIIVIAIITGLVIARLVFKKKVYNKTIMDNIKSKKLSAYLK